MLVTVRLGLAWRGDAGRGDVWHGKVFYFYVLELV